MSSDWWRGAVIYQIYPLSFCDSDGDGLGDLPGVLSRLDYVASLGVDAIWLSPFFPSPLKDFGYDVADHCAVHPALGTLAHFDAIVEKAHRLGLKVMIDQVWSHTSDQHAWFRESRSGRDTAKADWYTWADPRPDGGPPNNWLSVFGGGAWTWNPIRRQYYLHHFLSEQPSLNLRNEAVVEALLDSARFWLDRGVDGFRFDAVDFMFHDPDLRDNPPRPPADGEIPSRPFRLQYHQHDMMGAGTHEFLARIRALADAYGAITLGEVSSEDGALERCLAYSAPGEGKLHMAYTLGLMKRGFTPELFEDAFALQARASEAGFCWAFSNHDVERAVSRWGGAKGGDRFGRLLMNLLLALPGTVCLYQGEELGLPQAKVPHERMRDPYGAAFHPVFSGRDGSRTPMPWTMSARHAGFSAARTPWLPVPRAHRSRAVDVQEADPGSILNSWRAALRWRRLHPELRTGRLHPLSVPGPTLAFERFGADGRVFAAFNFSAEPVTLHLGADAPMTPVGGHDFAGLTPSTVRLDAYGAVFARAAVEESRADFTLAAE